VPSALLCSANIFLVSTNVTSALEVFFKNDMRYINSRFTYLLTYFNIFPFIAQIRKNYIAGIGKTLLGNNFVQDSAMMFVSNIAFSTMVD